MRLYQTIHADHEVLSSPAPLILLPFSHSTPSPPFHTRARTHIRALARVHVNTQMCVGTQRTQQRTRAHKHMHTYTQASKVKHTHARNHALGIRMHSCKRVQVTKLSFW